MLKAEKIPVLNPRANNQPKPRKSPGRLWNLGAFYMSVMTSADGSVLLP